MKREMLKRTDEWESLGEVKTGEYPGSEDTASLDYSDGPQHVRVQSNYNAPKTHNTCRGLNAADGHTAQYRPGRGTQVGQGLDTGHTSKE